MSFITPESIETVVTIAEARTAHAASGAGLYGPDLAAWPPWAVDSLVALERDRIAIENARLEAERSERD